MVSDWYRIETKKAGIAHHYLNQALYRSWHKLGFLSFLYTVWRICLALVNSPQLNSNRCSHGVTLGLQSIIPNLSSILRMNLF
jgi:hypothetical protein